MVENREVIRKEANLSGYSGGKLPIYPSTSAKCNMATSNNDNKGNTNFPMRTITLRGTVAGEA